MFSILLSPITLNGVIPIANFPPPPPPPTSRYRGDPQLKPCGAAYYNPFRLRIPIGNQAIVRSDTTRQKLLKPELACIPSGRLEIKFDKRTYINQPAFTNLVLLLPSSCLFLPIDTEGLEREVI